MKNKRTYRLTESDLRRIIREEMYRRYDPNYDPKNDPDYDPDDPDNTQEELSRKIKINKLIPTYFKMVGYKMTHCIPYRRAQNDTMAYISENYSDDDYRSLVYALESMGEFMSPMKDDEEFKRYYG